MKVLTVYGTRPELIKISQVIKEIDKNFEQILVDTGQNKDHHLNKIFLRELNIRKPNYSLNINTKSYSNIISDIFKKISVIIDKEKPDIFLIYGDTNSCLSAIIAKNKKIPIFHMEAGNRCFDQRVPEETNRKIIDHISDMNIVLSERARENLLKEGIHSRDIFKSGSHLNEIFNIYENKIKNNKILSKLNLNKKKFYLLSFHRSETVDDKDQLKEIIKTIKSIEKIYKCPILISTHPRTKNNLKKFKIKTKLKNIKFLKPFGFFDYIKLQTSAECVISDSGSLFEESALLKFPAISLRNSQERFEGMEYNSIILSGINEKNILKSIKAIKNNSYYDYPSDYLGGQVSKKIIKVILSNILRYKLKNKIGY